MSEVKGDSVALPKSERGTILQHADGHPRASLDSRSKLKRDPVQNVLRVAPRMLEMYLWLSLSLVVSAPFWFDIYFYGVSPNALQDIMRGRYYSLLTGVVVFLFPYMFRLIFDSLPFEAVRRRRASSAVERASVSTLPSSDVKQQPAAAGQESAISPKEVQSEFFSGIALHTLDAEALLASLAYDSKRISERIYARAGVYLLVGVLIAFSGLGFFYVQSLALASIKDVSALLLALAPRFGVLFFIEFIAFFFLRQYREAMGEYRYFEAVKRGREENLAVIALAARNWDGHLDLESVISLCSFNAPVGRLGRGETTEHLEGRRLSKDELIIFERILDVLAVAKGKVV